MPMKLVDIHIGQEIKKIVEQKYASYSEFGRQIGKSRQNIQSQIFSKNSLHTNMLVKLSNTLGVNLFKLFVDAEESVSYSNDKTKILLNFQMEITPEEWKEMKLSNRLKIT